MSEWGQIYWGTMARSTSNPHGLTDLQLKFCQEYAKSLNASQDYRAAGYQCKNDGVVRSSAANLLANPNIKAYLGETLNLSSISVVHETAAIAFANITDAVEWDEDGVRAIPSKRLTHRGKSAIKSIRCRTRHIRDRETGEVVETITEWEVTMHDKLAALEKLMRKLSLYPKNGAVREEDILDKMLEMNIVPSWIADCANKAYIRAREEVAALLQGHLSEPLIYQLSKEREATGGLSEATYNAIRAEIMGIDAQSIPQISAGLSEESSPGEDCQEE